MNRAQPAKLAADTLHSAHPIPAQSQLHALAAQPFSLVSSGNQPLHRISPTYHWVSQRVVLSNHRACCVFSTPRCVCCCCHCSAHCGCMVIHIYRDSLVFVLWYLILRSRIVIFVTQREHSSGLTATALLLRLYQSMRMRTRYVCF